MKTTYSFAADGDRYKIDTLSRAFSAVLGSKQA